MSHTILTEPTPGDADQVLALEELRTMFTITPDLLLKLSDEMLQAMNDGLAAHEHRANALPMLPTCIDTHPSGDEVGEVITLELTGSFVKVYQVELHGREAATKVKQQKFQLTNSMMKCGVSQLMDHLAAMVDTFLTHVGKNHSQQPHSTQVPLTYVISQPLYQTSIHRASVADWTKSFSISGSQDKNLADLLQLAFYKKKVPVVVTAIVNSTAASLLANDYHRKNTLLSCSISNGTNAAYWEKLSAAPKLGQSDSQGETIINTEWGSFGDDRQTSLPLTMYDNRLNRHSKHHGKHVFEKMVSGKYLGELVRWILVEFLDRRLLFDGEYTKELDTAYAFDTSYIQQITNDRSPDLDITGHILQDIMGFSQSSLVTRRIVKMVCELVSQRAARLMSAAIATVVSKRSDWTDANPSVVVSVEGSVYDSLPNFPRRLQEGLDRILGDRVQRIQVKVTKDDNGIGGAVAAILARQAKS